MTVWIVLVNGKVDMVFADRTSADAHAHNKLMQWNLTEVVEKSVERI